ncbi:MAG: aldehyde dehydrogenase family protein [Gaiellaceae bacterium]
MSVDTRTLQNFIGGRWVPASTDETVDDVNPADPGDVLARVPLSTKEDAEAAVAAASDAFPAWRAMSPVRRGQILVRASRLLEERQEELVRLLTREQGKTLTEARAELPRVIQFWSWMGYQVGSIQGVTAPTESDRIMALTLREPLGVVSLITPWNFPLNIPGWKLASALVCGNTVVFKPAQLTPLCGAALVETLAEAGVPDGVVNLVLGSGRTVGDRLVSDPRIRGISFTGSTATGLSINASAARLGKRVQAEMGGHNAVVVLEDADLDRAATGSVAACYGTTGQRCTAPRRIIAVRSIAADLTERLGAATRAVRVGPGDQEGADIGPMVDETSLREVLEQIERAKAEGAVVVEGGRRAGNGAGYFLQPTLLAKVAPTMTIAREEVFGPVLPILEVDDFDEAIAVAVSTRYGLSSSIYTRDLEKAIRFMHETDTGVVHINKPPIGAEAHLPFGGLKESAVGPKELGAAAEFFTQTKTVYLDYS